MADPLTKFAPSANQLAVLKAFQDADYDCTVDAACQKADVARQTYYFWYDVPEFVQWWGDEHDAFFRRQTHRVTANLFKGANSKFAGGKEPDPKPDAALIKLFLERFDAEYMPKTQQSVDLKSSGDFTFHIGTDGGDLAGEPKP